MLDGEKIMLNETNKRLKFALLLQFLQLYGNACLIDGNDSSKIFWGDVPPKMEPLDIDINKNSSDIDDEENVVKEEEEEEEPELREVFQGELGKVQYASESLVSMLYNFLHTNINKNK